MTAVVAEAETEYYVAGLAEDHPESAILEAHPESAILAYPAADAQPTSATLATAALPKSAQPEEASAALRGVPAILAEPAEALHEPLVGMSAICPEPAEPAEPAEASMRVSAGVPAILAEPAGAYQ